MQPVGADACETLNEVHLAVDTPECLEGQREYDLSLGTSGASSTSSKLNVS